MESEFAKLANEVVFVVDSDGKRGSPIKCTFGNGKSTVFDESAHFEEGQLLERDLPNGRTERYRVESAHYGAKFQEIPGRWSLQVVKVTSTGAPIGERSESRSRIVISNSSNVQVGTGNVQTVTQGLELLVQAIESAQVSPEERRDVKSLFSRLLSHPASIAVFGAVAGEISKKLINGQ
ncbi:MAG: hypothetical protein HUU19_10075 [Phycisphaerales bacterium]|nr:hypothetical protein [Phycisphaerales bacterium]